MRNLKFFRSFVVLSFLTILSSNKANGSLFFPAYWEGGIDGTWSTLGNWKKDAEGTTAASFVPDQFNTTNTNTQACSIPYIYFTDLGRGQPTVNLMTGNNNSGQDDSDPNSIQIYSLTFTGNTSFTLNLSGTNMEVPYWEISNSSNVSQTINVSRNYSLDYNSIFGMTINNRGLFRQSFWRAQSNNTINNIGTNATDRGTTVFLEGGEVSGGVITNNGGATWLKDTASFSSVTLRNQINNNVPGYLGVQSNEGAAVPFIRAAPLGIDINANTNGFVILKDGASVTITDPSSLVLYLEPGSFFNNASRWLFLGSGQNEGGSVSWNGETLLLLNTDGTPLTSVTATLVAGGEGDALQDLPAGVVIPDGIAEDQLDNALYPLLRVVLNGGVPVQESVQKKVQSIRMGQTSTLNKLRAGIHNIARHIVERASGVRGSDSSSKESLSMRGLQKMSFQTLSASDSFLSLTDGMMGVMAEETFDRFAPLRTDSMGIWAQPFGQVAEQRSSTKQTGYDSRATGIVFGIDHKVNSEFLVGGALGTAQSNTNLKDGSGKTQVKDYFVTLFGNWFKNKWFVEGFLSISTERFKEGRVVNDSTVASNQHAGYQVVPSLGFGRRLDWNGYGIIPFAHSTLLYGHENKYAEKGAGLANQRVKARDAATLRTEAGIDMTLDRKYEDVKAVYGLGVSAVLNDPVKKSATNGTVEAGNTFGVRDVSKKAWGGVLRLSNEMMFDSGWFANFYYTGEFAACYQAHEGALRIGKRF